MLCGSKIRQNVQKYDRAIIEIQDLSIHKMKHDALVLQSVARASKIRQNVPKYDKAILEIQDLRIYKIIHDILKKKSSL